jgi:hypothetical protein
MKSPLTVQSWLLAGILCIGIAAILLHIYWASHPTHEAFQDPLPSTIAGIVPSELSTVALDSAPTTSEVKQHYKNVLLFADYDIRNQGIKGLRILADFRDRVYGPRDFRTDLTEDDFLANWPTWLPPRDPAVQDIIPDATTAAASESKLLAYLQKNWPVEPDADAQTGSVVRGIIEDFGFRFVFDRDTDVAQVRPDFLRQSPLRNWTNPTIPRKAIS